MRLDYKLDEAATVEKMRAAIHKLRRHDPVISTVFDDSDMAGRNGEDRMTILAYALLSAKLNLTEQLLDLYSTTTTRTPIHGPD